MDQDELRRQLRVAQHNERHHRERADALAENFRRWQDDHRRHWRAVHALVNVQRKAVSMRELMRALDLLNEEDADGQPTAP